MNRYPVPADLVRTEEVIKRSRFITTLARAATVDEAKELIELVRDEFADATHNCWAYLVGPPGSTAQVGMSDDGEPHGTAGRPMLNALLHSGAGDVVAVVTRYYGGTKLGKGGLVRAYSGGVGRALDQVELRDKVSWQRMRLTFDYASLELFRRLCPELEAEIEDEAFSDRVTVTVRMPEERAEAFKAMVIERLAGRVEVGDEGQ